MISRFHRFHGHNALTYAYKNGKTIRGSFYAVKYAPNQRDGYRLAVVVGRKVHKSAVQRNRIRRRLYEIVRRLEDRKITPVDIVITVFDEKAATMPATELEKLIRSQFIQTGLCDNQ